MSDMSAQIERVLQTRSEALPAIRAEIDNWEDVDQSCRELERALQEAASDPAIGSEVRPFLTELQRVSPLQKLEGIRTNLGVVRERFERTTVNLGVSGQARVGKSTLLQTLSGLTDDQIPTGSGIPVTAVRSRIYDSPEDVAKLHFHSYESFRDEVLKPFFTQLKLGHPPRNPDEFSSLSLSQFARYEDWSQSAKDLFRRLEHIQASFPTYRDELVGGEKPISLDELRKHVAYPTVDEAEAGGLVDRKYLAVRDARILCKFPKADVRKLCLIDLPGLGEISPEAEERHVRGLRNDVDVVVLVKRPKEGMAYWRDEDAQAAHLVGTARGDISRANDFLFIACNEGAGDNEQVKKALQHSLKVMNQGRPNDPYTILNGDAANLDSAYADILEPVLQHLAENLARMDREVLNGARDKNNGPRNELLSTVETIQEGLRDISKGGGEPLHELVSRAKLLREELSVSLRELVKEWYERARNSGEDEEYIAAVNEIHDRIKDELPSGFGEGQHEWEKRLFREMSTRGGYAGVAETELNRLRVEISNRFSRLDVYFEKRIDELVTRIAEIVKANTGPLLDGLAGREALETLAQLAADAEVPALGIENAVNDLLRLRIEYRSHLHPQVRRELDMLRSKETDPETGEERDVVQAEVSQDGAASLRYQMVKRASRAAWQTRKALLTKAVLPDLIFHSALEQFEDAVIRHKTSEEEFRSLGSTYRDDIWPSVFEGLKLRSTRINKLRKALNEARAAIEQTKS